MFRRASRARQFAVVPVENSTEGAVGRTLDLLLSTPLRICGEVELRVHQNLMAKSDSLAGISKRLFARAVARAVQRLAGANLPDAERVPVVEQRRGGAAGGGEAAAAAIAGEAAAERYGLRAARAQHRGRAEQHHALPRARQPRARADRARPHLARHVGAEQARRGARAAHARSPSTA